MTPAPPDPSSWEADRAERNRAAVLDAALDGEKASAGSEDGHLRTAGDGTDGSWTEADMTVGLNRLISAAGAARDHHQPPALPPDGLARLLVAAGRQRPALGHRS
jgi:hypothetical protein